MSEEIGSIKVSIFGRDYNIRGGSDSEYIRKLAAHVDSVMRDIADKTGSLSSGRVAILAALNIADEMFKEAIERNVAYVVGSAFHPTGGGHNTLRLNFSYSSDEEIREGIQRLAGLVSSRQRGAA